jgi:pyruvate,orthophosphate dikinase
LLEAIRTLEKNTGKKFGGLDNPLLLSVRSGAKFSMPGMMDTILNLGLNDDVTKALATKTNNLRFAYDSYRRFLEMYGSVVLDIPHYLFEDAFENQKINHNIIKDSDISAEILQNIISDFKEIIVKQTGQEFETDPHTQLTKAIEAVFKSWMSSRAKLYRKINNIPDEIGTAVNVQSMVFGNKGDASATGVIFTRSPSDGTNEIFGEFLINAQGEDVVAGIRTPLPILTDNSGNNNSMQELMPEAFRQLREISKKLEHHYRDIQDIEFTIEEGKLYILQTRNAKRTATSAIKIAVDL